MAEEILGTSLLDPTTLDDPYPFYNRLREEAPVWKIGETGIYAATTFEMVIEAAGRIEDFSSNMKCLLYRDDDGMPGRFEYGSESQALATADPPLHPIHRSAVFPSLVTRQMEAIEPDIQNLVAGLMDVALEKRAVDFMGSVGDVVPITVTSNLIGFRDANIDDLWNAAINGTKLVSATLTFDDLMTTAVESMKTVEWISEQIDFAIKSPSEDILGSVAASVTNGVLTQEGAVGILTTLLSAAGETTTSLIGNAARILADDQKLQELLRQNPELVPVFIEEALRFESPFRYHMRSVPKDTELGGVAIPEGSTVLMLWGSANRDPSEFDNPDELDLERRIPKHHIAFGRGIHHCVGAPLARIEARVVLTSLLSRTSSFTVDPAKSPGWVRSLQVRRHEALPLILEAS